MLDTMSIPDLAVAPLPRQSQEIPHPNHRGEGAVELPVEVPPVDLIVLDVCG